MRSQALRLSIIVPTKNRGHILPALLESIRRLNEVEKIRPELIVADNDSSDDTYEVLASMANNFPAQIRIFKVFKPGKSAAINAAVKTATGGILAFLDDDVVVDETWLTALENFFRDPERQAGQGIIRLPSPEKDDPEIRKLVERYRTIPSLEHKRDLKTVHSINGANFFVSRQAFDRIGGFDERLGPGASGTSEDVDFARRLIRAGITIGYAPQAVVYHRVERSRLTEEYFKESHRRQGISRYMIRRHGTAVILANLLRAVAQYAYYSVRAKERSRYRSKGRIYHYLGMMEAKQNQIR